MAEMERVKGADHADKPGQRKNSGRWKKPTLAQICLIVFLLGIAVFWVGSVIQMFSSFEERVSGRINLQDITSIEIIRSMPSTTDEVKVTVTDPAKIADIMNAFADVKLMSSSFSHDFNRSYWISIIVGKSLRFGIRLDDQKYIYINDLARKDKYSSGSFKIINHYDMRSIDRLFE
ncbi:hypothetical protein [Paenibacillus jilunlii]|uniref:Uncharacterized protein n=1 Tax=Paenibacillus jilunlii TaxID=682956 RepID=A0A1G9ZJZ4_9BACL|nr:hypothetical protein [Paenibacillus jilunlii]KWX78341.1 hypothetical protein AML91_05395 [Paenibacillus jilunlii]SDN21618.1 hypothetical protein SAMN05216191_1321 [Paenibacillus jilunlii]